MCDGEFPDCRKSENLAELYGFAIRPEDVEVGDAVVPEGGDVLNRTFHEVQAQLLRRCESLVDVRGIQSEVIDGTCGVRRGIHRPDLKREIGEPQEGAGAVPVGEAACHLEAQGLIVSDCFIHLGGRYANMLDASDICGQVHDVSIVRTVLTSLIY